MAPSLSSLMPGFTPSQYSTKQTERVWKTAKQNGSNGFKHGYKSLKRDKFGIPQEDFQQFHYTHQGIHAHVLKTSADNCGLHTDTKDSIYIIAPYLRKDMKQEVVEGATEITKKFPKTELIETDVATVFDAKNKKPAENIRISLETGTLTVTYLPGGKIQHSFNYDNRHRLSTESDLDERCPRDLNGNLIIKGIKTLPELAIKSISDTALSSPEEFEGLLPYLNPAENTDYSKIQKYSSQFSSLPALYQNLREHYGFKAPDPVIARQKRAENRFQEAKATYKTEVGRQQVNDIFIECNKPNVPGTIYVDAVDRRKVTLSPNHRNQNRYTAPATTSKVMKKIWSHFNPDTVNFDNTPHQNYRRFKEAKDIIWRSWSKKKDYNKQQKQMQGAAEVITAWYRRRKDINSRATKMINTAKTLKELEKVEKATKTIQRIYRGHQGRVEAKKCHVERAQAAKIIQRVYRGHQGRVEAKAIKVQKTKEKDLKQVSTNKLNLPKLSIGKHGISFSRKPEKAGS